MLVCDAVEFVVEFAVGKPAADVERQGLLALPLQRFESPREGDRLRLGYGSLRLALGDSIEFIKDIAWVTQEPLHVGPDGWLDGLHSNRAGWAATRYRPSLDQFAAAAVSAPGAVCGADQSQTAHAAVDHSPQQVDVTAVLGRPAVAGQGLLSGLP